MSKYIYNITLTTERELLEDVLFYLRARLLPCWRSYDAVAAVRLLRLPEDAGYALQLEGEDREALEALHLSEDEELMRLIQQFHAGVLPFMTKLEVLEDE